MPLRNWLGVLISLSIGCTISAPRPEVCAHDLERGNFSCYDTEENERRRLEYEETNKYICISPDDYNEILDFIDEITGDARGLRSEGLESE